VFTFLLRSDQVEIIEENCPVQVKQFLVTYASSLLKNSCTWHV
jgi:hypothetical protein